MIAETRTLSELSLVPDSVGEWPFAPLLDHTHSKQGKSRLLRLIASPLPSKETICLRQQLLSALARVAAQIDWQLLIEQASAVTQFLSTNFDYSPPDALGRTLFSLRFSRISEEIANAIRTTSDLFASLRVVHDLLSTLPHDPTFSPIIVDLYKFTQCEQIQLIDQTVRRKTKNQLLALDSIIRDPKAVTPRLPDGRSFRSYLEAAIEAIWQVDAFCSLAAASESLGGTYPKIDDGENACFEVCGLRHPLLLGGVPNDLKLSPTERVAYITGPNMAGKSTLLRSVAIAVHFSHLGMKIAATYAQVPFFNRLLVSITVRDSLARGESLYLAEIRRVGTIVSAIERGERVAGLFDEVFRGTNVVDATEATSLLVDALSGAAGCRFFIASHLAQVVADATSPDGVIPYFMHASFDASGLAFSHKLQRGVSSTNLGMLLLDTEGVGPALRKLAASKGKIHVNLDPSAD